MTTDLPELHPTRDFINPPRSRAGVTWALLGLVGLAAGYGAATWAVGGSEPPEPSAAAVPAAAPAEPAPEGDAPAVAAAEQQTAAEDPSPTLEPTESEDDVPVTPSTDGAFFVQVASYKSASDADGHVRRLGTAELPAKSHHDATTGAWHKVRLGPFATRVDAEKARFKLQINERRDAYVMPRSNGKYHVQVGSFETRAQAEPLAKRLTERGHVTKISRIKMGDKRWHCVRVGPFDTYDEAEGYEALVRNVPGSDPRVIPFAPIEKK